MSRGWSEYPCRWWETHENVSFLAFHMAHNGAEAFDLALMIDKPWKWTIDYRVARQEYLAEITEGIHGISAERASKQIAAAQAEVEALVLAELEWFQVDGS